MKVKIENKQLVITIPLTAPTESKSGKSLLVATTHGAVATGVMIQDRPVIVSLNAYLRVDKD